VTVPPYCGVPTDVVVVVVDVVVLVVVVVVVVVVVAVVLVVEVDLVVDDVVFVAQDAKTRDATMIQVSSIQVIPLFIQTSFFLGILPEN